MSNDGEQIVILGESGSNIKDFTYNDVEPWPTSADGEGEEFHDQYDNHALIAATLTTDSLKVSQLPIGVPVQAPPPATPAFPQQNHRLKRNFGTAASVDQLLADACFMDEFVNR